MFSGLFYFIVLIEGYRLDGTVPPPLFINAVCMYRCVPICVHLLPVQKERRELVLKKAYVMYVYGIGALRRKAGLASEHIHIHICM